MIAAAVAVSAWGASSVVAKVVSLGALAIGAYRFAAYFVIISLWRAARGQYLSWRAFKHSLVGGVLLAIDVALFFTAVKLTTVVNATIIGSLQPLILTLYGVRFLGERVSRKDVMLGLAGLAGVAVIVFAGTNSGDASLLGDLTAVGALLAWSAYFVFAKRADGIVSPTDYTLAASLIVVLVSAPLALAFGQSLAWPSWSDWGWLLLMALGAGILGHNLMNWSLPRIPLWLGSTMTLMVPVTSSAIAWVFLDEPLNAVQIIAMIWVIIALGLLVRGQTSAPTAAASTTTATSTNAQEG